jgi:hypothetical protein
MRNVGFGTVHLVSGNYFDVLGVRPAVGRMFTPDDDVSGTTAAIISYPFWQRAFGGDPQGRSDHGSISPSARQAKSSPWSFVPGPRLSR